MDKLRNALQAATTSGQDVAVLLRSVKVLLGPCDARIKAVLADGEPDGEGTIRRLASDIGHFHLVAAQLAQIATGLTGTARDLDAGVSTLASACELALHGLEVAESALGRVMERSVQDLEVVCEAALRREVAPEVVTIVDELLRRMGRPAPSQTPKKDRP